MWASSIKRLIVNLERFDESFHYKFLRAFARNNRLHRLIHTGFCSGDGQYDYFPQANLEQKSGLKPSVQFLDPDNYSV
jgi:hypothetical protein